MITKLTFSISTAVVNKWTEKKITNTIKTATWCPRSFSNQSGQITWKDVRIDAGTLILIPLESITHDEADVIIPVLNAKLQAVLISKS